MLVFKIMLEAEKEREKECGGYRTHTSTLSITNKQTNQPTNKQAQNYYKPQRKTIRNIREEQGGRVLDGRAKKIIMKMIL